MPGWTAQEWADATNQAIADMKKERNMAIERDNAWIGEARGIMAEQSARIAELESAGAKKDQRIAELEGALREVSEYYNVQKSLLAANGYHFESHKMEQWENKIREALHGK